MKNIVLICIVSCFLFSCKKEDPKPASNTTNTPITPKPDSLYIGKSYKGGIIFYIDSTNLHGLIVDPYGSLPELIAWSETNTLVSVFGSEIGKGLQNTRDIIQKLGSKTAAYGCAQTLGYSFDWFLPSKNELEQLKLSALNNPEIGKLFTTQTLWSSTEWDDKTVYTMMFGYPLIKTCGKSAKSSKNDVRACRYF